MCSVIFICPMVSMVSPGVFKKSTGLVFRSLFRTEGFQMGLWYLGGGDRLLVSPHTVLTLYTTLLLHIWILCSYNA